MAGGIRALSKKRIYLEEGAGKHLFSVSVKTSLCFQLGWLISQLNLTMLNNLISCFLGT